MPRADDTASSPMGLPGPSRNRRAELDAAFDSDAQDLPRATVIPTSFSHLDKPPGYDDAMASKSNTQDDVFFDAGDAMPNEPPQPRRSVNTDPLGASGANSDDDDDDDVDDDSADNRNLLPRSSTRPTTSASTSTTPNGGYDFERASYFNTSRSRSASTSAMQSPHANASGGDTPYAQNNTSASASRPPGMATGPNASGANSTFSRARVLLGRFGRFAGMRVPGAAYSTLAQDDGNGNAQRPRRVMGGGLGQDGVFANLNAKPEGRRRRNGNHDRGDDDDLEDETLPPTYEVAAADAAPGYWETTIAPGGMGWTPGGGHVGDVEDLILEGLPIGNFFGFAWNLLVSMCFQFVGFLLTYLLHTTHAARCGSRAGLGITLIQYGFYLRTRAVQLSEDGNAGGIPGGDFGDGTEPQTFAWWGGTIVYPGSPTSTSVAAAPSARNPLWDPPVDPPAPTQPSSALSAIAASATTTAVNALSTGGAATNSIASAFAAEGDGLPANTTSDASQNMTSEWLAYALMVIGWFLLLSSVLSYWRVHRWGRALVAASRREQESTRAAENGGEPPEIEPESANAPVGFIHRLAAIIEQQQQRAYGNGPRSGRSTGTGEDWVIYPGMSARSGGRDGAEGGNSSTTTTNNNTPTARSNSGHGLTVWGAAPRVGSLAFPVHDERPRSDHRDDEDEDSDEMARLTGVNVEGEAHLSPEERRMLRGLRGAGLM